MNDTTASSTLPTAAQRKSLLANPTLNFQAARNTLLSSIWLPDKSKWYTAKGTTFLRLVPAETLVWRGLVPPDSTVPLQLFRQHDVHTLQDAFAPPTTPGTNVHRFRLIPQVVQDIQNRVRMDEEQRHILLSKGEKVTSRLVSNVGGYHGPTLNLCDSSNQSSWSTPLLDVVKAALRSIKMCPGMEEVEVGEGEKVNGEEKLKQAGGQVDHTNNNGSGLEVTGWLNVSSAFDFNSIHDHGTADWSFVYYVDVPSRSNKTGDKEEEDSEEGTDDDDDDDEDDMDDTDGGDGRLLLRTQLKPKHYGVFSINPKPGDLWAFPGRTLHAVMPAKLTSSTCRNRNMNSSNSNNSGSSEGNDDSSGSQSSRNHHRISLAINCILPQNQSERAKRSNGVISQLKPLYSEALLASIGLH